MNFRTFDSQDNKSTFEWDALKGKSSNVTQIANVAISTELAEKMETNILSKKDAGFYLLPAGNDLSRLQYLIPELQKGDNVDGQYTCVGLVEWSAESSGHKNGQGFIPNSFESITVPIVDDFGFAWPPIKAHTERWGLLSPELLYWFTSGRAQVEDVKDWLQGFFDPIDFVITDPLGRRIGYSKNTGILHEIPRALYSGDGLLEQFLITAPIPGIYKIELFGLGEKSTFGIASEKHGVGMENKFFGDGEQQTLYFVKEVVPGGIGDIDGDGDVDNDDEIALSGEVPRFTSNPNDPGDLNGDGILNEDDVELIKKLKAVVNDPYPVSPDSVKQPPEAIPTLSELSYYMLSLMLIAFAVVRFRNIN